MKIKLTLSTLAILVIGTTNAFSTTALFDEGHGQHSSFVTGPEYSELRSLLTGAGHSMQSLTASITPDVLVGIDLFITGSLDFPMTPAEISVLQDFVASGGNVLVCHDGGFNSDSATPSVNSLLLPYGMVLGDADYGTGVVVNGFADHCVTNSVNTLGLDYCRLLVSIVSPAQDLTTGTIDIMAVYDNGNQGMVVALPDLSLWKNPGAGSDYNIQDFDNAAVLLNIFDCSFGPVATVVLSLGSIKALYR